ncbi:NAD(P)-binding domain-containing protein [Phreatobacter stygius]|nr:NAD(P)/FAD-dependent oxidoreductase [Phreatobacter stygius]
MDQDVAKAAGAIGLDALTREARRDLARLNFPAANWVLPVDGPDGRPVLDVLVVGGGMVGQTAGFALMRDGIRHIRIVDRAPRGGEGPWGTYARMLTLRSPKHVNGPDLGVASLTFRAWYEAQHGEAAFEALHKAGRLDWLAYLLWVRETVGIPVENGVAVTAIEPVGGLVRASLAGPAGAETVWARKVVMASGRDGSGAPRLPAYPSLPDRALAHGRVFHSMDDIDFQRFAGGSVAVLGGGASAFDNAGTALEAGATKVMMFLRRPMLPQINKSKWTGFPGFLNGFTALDDELRWRFYTYIFAEQVPPPYESVLRCEQHAGFTIRFDETWTDIEADTAGVTIVTPKGRHRFDAAILGTGFDVDLLQRPECASFRDDVLLWRDRVGTAKAAADPEPARFPYLGPGFELLPRDAAPAGIAHIHMFNWGVTMSHGALAGDVPGIAPGANRLAQALVRALFVEDAEPHWQRLLVHDDEELKPTGYFVAPEDR